MKELVLMGGGHSHAIALRLLGMLPLSGVRLTLITDVLHAPYSGMLPGHISGFYDFETCHINLLDLAKFAKANLILDRAVGLDLSNQRVLCERNSPVTFDWLSIDIGSTPATMAIPGAAAYTIPAKPVPLFLAQWEKFLAALQSDRAIPPDRPLRVGIVGGGAGGVELSLAIATRLETIFQAKGLSAAQVEMHLFHRQPTLMAGYSARIGDRLCQLLTQRGIHLHLQESVSAVIPESEYPCDPNTWDLPKILLCQSGLTVICDRIFWVTHATAPQWIQQTGLATDEQGFILIDNTLRSVSHPEIFATGDIANMIKNPRPKAGVFAVRQGKPLFDNLRRVSLGRLPVPFYPQKRHLALIGTGKGEAVAVWGNFCVGPSTALWHWKDWLDRQFMEQFIGLG
ncbi:FAD-dependent oxidoreductase [Tumidithrix helvetica PCC 7403]|uniref:FAD-dependent oxidoreductase n=1 Tax=Tumidithrix helvetica TaxID=3457545 RepID=UPI003CA8FABB